MDFCLLIIGLFTNCLCIVTAQPSFHQFLKSSVKDVCPDVELTQHNGVVSSPFYPNVYPSHLSCTWHIQGNAGDIITIEFDDIDIEESCCCESQPCCLTNWLKIGPLTDGSEQKICGREHHHSLTSKNNKLSIKFHVSEFSKGGRGFKFNYAITSNASCTSTEFRCGNNKCVPSSSRCNGVRECQDASDEHNCFNHCLSGRSCRSHFHCYDAFQHCDGLPDCVDFSDEMECGFCASDYVRCGLNTTDCYHPVKERCDGTFNCLNGADELDCFSICPGKVTCDSRRGCYSMKQRCNGITQCEDASDERNCVPELCNYEHGGFLCDNRRCIEQVWTCDRTDDCGDGSDERNCLRNGILTAAIMGSLICALLLVIAISCTCRLHALRVLESRIINNRETPFSRLSREFVFREPPPSYAVAVQNDPRHNLYANGRDPSVQIHRNRRRARRHRNPRSLHRPQVPPNVSLEPGRLPPVVSDVELLDDVSVSVGTQDLPLNQNLKSESSLVTGAAIVNKDETYCSATSSIMTTESSSDSRTLVSVCDNVTDISLQTVSGDNFCCDSDTDPLVV